MVKPKGVSAFPLQWPKGWKRTRSRADSAFKMTTSKSYADMIRNLNLMGATSVVVSTNCPLNNVGVMRMDREPVDPGVAVYCIVEGESKVFAADKYDTVGQNIRAVGVTIEALRTIQRHGTAELSNRAFSGFRALPATTEGPSWWSVLQIDASADEGTIDKAYKSLAKIAHPDAPTGSEDAMRSLNVAREQALAAARGRG